MPASAKTEWIGAAVTERLPARQRTALYLFSAALAAAVLEGAARKWGVGSETGLGSYLFYFSKDIAFGALLLLSPRAGESAVAERFRSWLVPGCALVLAGALLSTWAGRMNFVGAMLSLRALVVLPVIAWLAVRRLAGLPLRYAAMLLGGLTILNYLLSTVQNQLPPDHILNRYVVSEAAVVAEQSGVRATGTFSYISGLSIMSSVGVWAGLVLLSVTRSKPMTIFGGVTLLAGFGCGLASISRAPVIVAGLMVAGWLLLSQSARSRVLSSAGVLGVAVGALLLTGQGSQLKRLWSGVAARHETASDTVHERAFGQFRELWEAAKTAPLGRGFGTEQVGGNYAVSGTMGFTNYESQFPRIVMESGILGFAGFSVVCAGALVSLRHARQAARSAAQQDALLATQLVLLTLFYTNVVFNHTASAFAWMLFAAVLAAASPAGPAASESNFGHRKKIRRRVRRSSFAAGRGDDGAGPRTGRPTPAVGHPVDI